jgi:hypothetical protein
LRAAKFCPPKLALAVERDLLAQRTATHTTTKENTFIPATDFYGERDNLASGAPAHLRLGVERVAHCASDLAADVIENLRQVACEASAF